ncbi:MAG: hypothetical protein GY774_09655 [Planctomycetes bacterium]|nr:hypothetical protein [Planctomycetota bacterium]
MLIPLKSFGYYLENFWPDGVFNPLALEELDDIWMEPLRITEEPHLKINTTVLFDKKELFLQIPGIEDAGIVIGSNGEDTFLMLEIDTHPTVIGRVVDIPIAIRIPSSLLQPAIRVWEENRDIEMIEPMPDAEYLDIRIATAIISGDFDGNLSIDSNISIELPLCIIGNTGIAVEASSIQFFGQNNNPPPGKPLGWRGVYIASGKIYLPGELSSTIGVLEFTDSYLGNGGFSGTISNTWTPPLSTNLFGIDLTLTNVELNFVQNSLSKSEINGAIKLPFFDEPVNVEIGINLDGGFFVKLSSGNGLHTIRKEDIFEIEIDSLAFEVKNRVLIAKLSGEVTPLFGAPELEWPSFKVEELAIDSEGNVYLEGGWLNLREQYSLDFHGFQMEITKLGFGKTEDGGKWIGFSGGLKLVDGLSAGASVEGLRITWYDDDRDTKITFNGVGVEFEVPEVLCFKGAVSYDGNTDQFAGDIKLDLISLDLQVDGTIVFGQQNGENYMAIYLAAELPSGIPLWSTGLALYGMAGLFALEMEPDKKDNQEWYGMGGGEDSWYHSGTPGVTALTKWRSEPGSLALGAGVTIGTLSDNGYAFSGKMLLAIVFPGPILLIEGKANLLKERAKLDGDEPNFRALAVLDKRAGTFLIGLDAQYKYDSEGKLIDIRGSAEAFFDFDDASLWHLYLGEREPRGKRIRAEIFKLLEADAYFMLDANQLAMGAWVGYDKNWKFGPLRVTVEAWIEGNVIVSWKPAHFYGDLWLHGKAELAVWRFDTGLTVAAQIAADVFDPFHVLGEFSVGINLSWPLPDFDVDITLEWGPEHISPPLPLPLKEIAIEHFKVTTSWPLPRGEFLLPNYDTNDDGFIDGETASGPEEASDLENLPVVVPLDCRPHITFSRPVNDDAVFVGINPQLVDPEYERIGDPAKNEGPVRVRYGLKEVVLEKYVGGIWNVVAQTPEVPDKPRLFGSWAPVPAMPDGGGEAVAQTKLWIWSKTPFDYTRHTGRAWDEWFTGRFSDYPCIPEAPDKVICCDFENLAPGQRLRVFAKVGAYELSHCPDYPEITFYFPGGNTFTVTGLEGPIDGKTQALCSERSVAELGVLIGFSRSANSVRVVVVERDSSATGISVWATDTENVEHGPFHPENHVIYIDVEHIVTIRIKSDVRLCIVEICASLGPDPEDQKHREEMEQHLRDEMARWAQEGDVLEPHTTYRLKVVTTIETKDFEPDPDFNMIREQTEFAYFRTEGPPGLTNLSTPIGHPNPDEFDSGLDELTRYVRQTVPATVPDVGEKPLLPRPVYRAYDVGVEFNENYVDLMYRLERRDLGLYLYDNNNRPVRDAQGRLIVLSNRWSETEVLILTESEERWITVVNESDCAVLDTTVIPHEKTLTSAAEGQVLDPDTVYEARLVPLLLHEDFGAPPVGTSVNGPSGTLDGWTVHDEGTNDAPSHWEIREEGDPPSRYLVQTSNIWGGAMAGTDPVKPGTMLLRADNPHLPSDHPDQPGNWTDYRLSVYLRSPDDDGIGTFFRYLDADHYYRFSTDHQRKYRRLVSVVNGVHTVLAEDDFVYRWDQDYLIIIEAIGASLRVYQNGTLVFDVTDDSIDRGRIGLYCWGNTGARFSDVRVDDFRMEAPIVYRFNFTTSQFANFFHHLHSFQDETWREELEREEPPDADVTALVAKAVPLADVSSEPSDEEARAYEALVEHVLSQAARQLPPEVQLTRVERDGKALAFLIQSPEPIDWKRTDLEVLRADRRVPLPELPGAVKLTDVTFGMTQPNEESVTLLLRKAPELTGHRIEYRRLPGPVAEPTGNPVLFVDEFEDVESGLLFRESFGPNALDHYTIVDEGTISAPSVWTVSDGHIVQTSNIYGESESPLDKPGTVALTGSVSWANVRIRTTLMSEDNDGIGFVFRYQDADNYYRFSMDSQRNHRHMDKRVQGKITLLWEDDVSYNLGQPYRLAIEAYGEQLLVYIDDALLFSILDPDISSGQVGFYCWGNTGAHFEDLSVEALESPLILWQPGFVDLNEIEIIDESGAIDGPSEWGVEDGVLIQSSNIHVEDDTPHQPGTFALGGSDDWEDVQISVRLSSDTEGAIGVMFRVSPHVSSEADESEETQDYNYYRFSMGREGSSRRLIKKVGSDVTVLWQDAVQYTVGQSYELTIRAVGSELSGYLDGIPLFTVNDSELKQGQMGFYCSANAGARFERVVVTDHTKRMGRWTMHDEGTVSAPSVWRLSNGALLQTSDIQGDAAPAHPGTYAVNGDSVWKDYRLEVKLQSDKDGTIGIIFRYVDQDNYYRLSLDAQLSYRLFIKKENGMVTPLWEDAGGYTVGERFTLTVDAIGSRLVGYIGETRLFDLTDSTHPAGQVGLYCSGNTGARFDRVEVRRPPLEAYALLRDGFADNDTSGWTFVNEGTVNAPSNWSTFEGALRQTSNIYTPPNDRDTLSKQGTYALAGNPEWTDVMVRVRLQSFDNDTIGIMFRYTDENNYYRFSIDSQRRCGRVVKNVEETFTLLWEDDFSYEVGHTYEVTIVAIGSTLRGYLDGVLMFTVEDGDLTSGLIGLYCWGNDDSRFSYVRVYPTNLFFNEWLLNEPFDFLIPGRWTFVDEGDQEGPSQWEVTEGELRQTSNIFGGSTDSSVPDKPGTYALGGDMAWTDYRINVRFISDDIDGAIGVMFRYRDADNYYRFSMVRKHNYRGLIKKIGGVVTVLWEDAVQYTLGREYIVTIDCVGGRLSVCLDGIRLFTVEDSDIASGRIGLYCWNNTGARFTEVQVAAPTWTPYYTFRREERLPAGTHARIFSGNAAEVSTKEPGVIRRFAASLNERGELRFPEEGVKLRIVNPNSIVNHARHFLPDHEYSPVNIKVLRKGDGTGFFIFATDEETDDQIDFSEGQYRLKMTYRRDNRDVDPESQVFSQAGFSNPEVVKIDIPWEL